MDIKQDYTKRINNVILYIENNLSSSLSIDSLAELACFSKFHFSRVFKSVTGESVYHYIKRVRLERASYYLWGSDHSIKDIARKCGFNSTSNFSYNYKQHFGVSAKEQRAQNDIDKMFEEVPDISVEVKEIPEMRLGYIKNIGGYNFEKEEIVRKLVNWMNANGEEINELVFMGYDSTYVTKSEHLRSDYCIPVSDNIEPNDDISIMNFPKIKVISTKIKSLSEIHRVRDDLDTWILASGYQTIIGVPTLIMHKDLTFIHSKEDDPCLVNSEICVPVKPR